MRRQAVQAAPPPQTKYTPIAAPSAILTSCIASSPFVMEMSAWKRPSAGDPGASSGAVATCPAAGLPSPCRVRAHGRKAESQNAEIGAAAAALLLVVPLPFPTILRNTWLSWTATPSLHATIQT